MIEGSLERNLLVHSPQEFLAIVLFPYSLPITLFNVPNTLNYVN